MLSFDRISLEPSRFCSKGCAFCYNGSNLSGREGFSAADVIALATNCAQHGVRFLSIGGGEPLEWLGLFEALEGLRGVLGRSFTTNGLMFVKEPKLFDACERVMPDKVHVSIHFPDNSREVERVCQQVRELSERGVPSGVNLLIASSQLAAARAAVETVVASGISTDRIVFLPSRGVAGQTPDPADVAWVATGTRGFKGPRFQSMTCLMGCGRSDRFVSIGADRTVAYCSYTVSRRKLRALTYSAVLEAIAAPSPLGLIPCDQALVRTMLPEAT